MLAVSANAVGAWFAAIVAFWKGHYFVPGAAFALGLGIILLVPLVAIALSRLEEIAAIAFGRAPRRLANAPPLVPGRLRAESVDPHSGLLRAAGHAQGDARCRGAARLSESRMRAGHQQHARSGAVAADRGALPRRSASASNSSASRTLPATRPARCALRSPIPRRMPKSSPSSTPITCVEPRLAERSGAAVRRSARRLRPVAAGSSRRRPLADAHAMNAEYAGFFDIGMVQRNEFNAIIMHGTMCLIRRAAIESAGGWSSDTIVEDTDLGLSMLEHGWIAHYTNRRYGHGLLPDTFEAYKRQRHRWAFGGFQLVRKHWRRMLPWADGLSREQKREYGIGWLNWLGSELHRRRRRASQHRLGAGRRLRQYRGARPHSHHADHRRVRGFGRAFRGALPAARARDARPDARRGLRRHVGAMDRGARRRHGRDPGAHAVPAHRQGRQRPQGPRLPGVLGGGDRGAPADRRAHARRHQLQAGPRDQYFRLRCWWCRACRSSRRWRSPRSRARASTTSPTGAASKPGPPTLLPRPSGRSPTTGHGMTGGHPRRRSGAADAYRRTVAVTLQPASAVSASRTQ